MTTSDEVRPLPGSSPTEVRKRLYVDFYNQWAGMFGGSNQWYDLTLVKLAGEYSPYKGSCEIEVSLLGLCWTFTYVYDRTFTDELMGVVNKIKESESQKHP